MGEPVPVQGQCADCNRVFFKDTQKTIRAPEERDGLGHVIRPARNISVTVRDHNEFDEKEGKWLCPDHKAKK